MPRGVKRQQSHVQLALVAQAEPYPEHAKLYPHTQANWAIREFFHWLRVRPGAPELIRLDFDTLDRLLMEFRGVDYLAYKAEAADLRSKYRWLWEQHEHRLPELATTIDETDRGHLVQGGQPSAEQEQPPVQEDPLQHLLGKVRKGGKS